MMAPPTVTTVLRARFTVQPDRIKIPESQPPSRLPIMAPTKGTQANKPICLTSKPKVSAR